MDFGWATNKWKLIGCIWIVRTKYKFDDIVGKYKAQLVAKGYGNKEGVDCEQISTPIAIMKSITMLFIATFYWWGIHYMDVKSAFMKGWIDE